MATEAEKSANESAYWRQQLKLADERVKKWHERAKDVVKMYEAQDRKQNAFNILYSNTETLLPALYNALPRPIAQRRYKDADPVSKAVCDTITRALEFSIDSPDAKYEAFDDVVRSAVTGALVPGLGITWFRYDFESQTVVDPEVEKGIAKEGTTYKGGDSTDEKAVPEEPTEEVTYEAVCAQDVSYTDFRWGYSRKWSTVPWVARRHVMTKADVRDQFGEGLVDKIDWQDPIKTDGDDKDQRQGDANNEDNQGSAKVCDVWEIWHKSAKKVYFVSPQYKEGLLEDPTDDPLGLSGFFPCPEPLQFSQKVSSLVPTPLYEFYSQQAKELNSITLRITRVINAMKVRGFYNGVLEAELSKLLDQDDNTLLAAKNAAVFEGKNLADQIWLMPLQELAGVLQSLVLERQNIKQTIYEITGISDILRGSTVASETATAQNLKSQWGTLRLKRLQKKVQTYVRSCMRIEAEIIAGKFSMQTLEQVTGLPFMQPEQKMMVQKQLQTMKQQVAIQPPADPQQQQQQQQQMQSLVQQSQSIDWGQVMEILRSNALRGYKIDIETNSTIDADATEDRQNINELLTALAQTMQGFAPAVEGGMLPMGAFRAIMLAISRRYEFGSEVEDELNSMPQQLPQKPDPQAQKVQQEMQLAQQQGQIDLKMKEEEQKTQRLKAELERARLQQKAQYEERKMQMDERKMLREEQAAEAEHQRKMQEMVLQASMPPKPTAQGKPNGKGTPRRV